MKLSELHRQADELSHEEREGLLSYLIYSLPYLPAGPDDGEVLRRDEEMEAGTIQALSHQEFLSAVGRLK